MVLCAHRLFLCISIARFPHRLYGLLRSFVEGFLLQLPMSLVFLCFLQGVMLVQAARVLRTLLNVSYYAYVV